MSVRGRAYLYEHMFPRLRQTITATLADRIDDLVEFSTLGEYVLADDLLPIATTSADRPCDRARSRVTAVSPPSASRRSRNDCPAPEWARPVGCDD